MSEWRLSHFRSVSGRSMASPNIGQSEVQVKYVKTFLNMKTGEVFIKTDLQEKLKKRDNVFKQFFDIYKTFYRKHQVSIIAGVFKTEKYPSVTNFISHFKKKIKRKGIEIFGHAWVRDLGEKKKEPHVHFLIATDRINAELWKELFQKKKHNDYDVEFLRNPKGLKKYLKDKKLFGGLKMRSYGCSRKFKTPEL